MHHRSAAAAHQPVHALQQKSASTSIPGPAPGDTIFHPVGPMSSSSPAADLQPSTYTQQQSIPSNSSPEDSQSLPGSHHEDTEPQLSALERMQRTQQLVSERLEGKDPLWFAKAFKHRAALNWASMKRMAGDMVSAVATDLGLQESDDIE